MILHSEWRKLAKKLRRKRIRQKLAEVKFEEEENARLLRNKSPSYVAWLEEQNRAEEYEKQQQTCEAKEREAEWLRVEEQAQVQFRALKIKLELAREEKAKQRERIRQEWEQEQQKLKALKEEKERQLEENQKQHDLVREQIENFIANGGKIPDALQTTFETNPNKPVCPFFHKTGACRFRDTCSRNHKRPGISRTILVPNFYTHYSLEQSETEHGDSALEYESHETYNHFRDFFYDVLPELEKCGHVRQFKVCCNHEPHLRGNVYVEYRSSREAIKCFQSLQGRWYGGRKLQAEFCGVESWASAICGLHFKQRCPKGSSCNFLHVFRNPLNMFYKADRDEHRTPPKLDVDSDVTPDTYNCRWSESPERLPRIENGKRKTRDNQKRNSHDRKDCRRSRSRETERRKSKQKHRDKLKQSSRRSNKNSISD